ncbi:MAG: hypothetical protein JO303_03305, partial [Caulobacteraceae bacterium]|nr:hypothetical protein [Caulobacteraceae bacterium]
MISAIVAYVTIGPFQHFPPVGWVDSGIYTGYFRHFSWMIHRYGATYFASRWPYIFPGWLIYRVFPAWAANAVFSAGWLSALLVGLRGLCRPALPAWVRKWTLVLFGCSPLVVAMVTRAYPDGAVAGIGLLGLILVRRGMVSDGGARLLTLAGAALMTVALLTQPGSLCMMAPMGLGLLLAVPPTDRRSSLLTTLIWGGVGALVTLIVYLAIVYEITGVGNWFGLMYSACCQNSRGAQYRWDISLWIFSATRICFVLLVLTAGLLTLLTFARGCPDPLRRFLAGSVMSTALSAALLVLSDTAMDMSLIQSSHYASYILPATATLLGAVLACWGHRLTLRDRVLGSIVVLFLATAGVALLMLATSDMPQESVFFPMTDLACAAAVVLAVVGCRRAPQTLRLGVVVLLVLALLPVGSISADTRHVFGGPGRSSGSTYIMLLTAADEIDEVVGERPVLFWFDRQGFNRALTHPLPGATVPNRQVFPLRFGPTRYDLNALDTLSAFYLWDQSRTMDQLPA